MSGLEEFSDTYQIIEKLGEGSGGIVYKAYHKRLKKEVVLKKMRSKSTSILTNRQEVDILKNLNHSYLPQVLDFLNTGDAIYTVISYIPGKSFQQLLEQQYHFSQSQLIRWGMQLCSALNYLHSQKPPIIHSDIKPGNIMLTPQGNICLIDFNISFFLDDNTVLGYSNGYTSPEQYIIALDSKSVHSIPNYSSIDEKTDIYSVGATFYHLAVGKKKGDFKDPIDKSRLTETTSEAFAQVISKAMQVKPEDRYSSAYEMFKAFQGISKRDKRYQNLIRKQRWMRAGMIAGMSGFIMLFGYGIHELHLERVDKYNKLVEKQTEYREKREYKKEDKKYGEAVKILPSALESYYQKACTLYEQQKYSECVEFIDYDILSNEKIDKLQNRMADVYYLKANSQFELKEYQQAVETFEKLFAIGGFNSEYYRDYAIALAYNGTSEKAQETLQKAIDYGLAEDSIYYAKGEIEKSLMNSENALADFRNCINITENSDLKARAYILSSKIYEETGQREEERNLLLQAEETLPLDNQIIILERLIQVDIDLVEMKGEASYRNEAVIKLNKVIEQGWETYETYDNLVILYEKQGELENAEIILGKMAELYGNDYNLYKRYAFLEIDKQELKGNQNRDYSKFVQYYREASQMYYSQLRNNNSDAEMGLLENVYEQVKSGGWIE